ncbi:MAG: dihydropyrimidinase [Lachnospiraceae bacterium]|nr:dihydropyrimidinase [Lachnospiraceae bacterium]
MAKILIKNGTVVSDTDSIRADVLTDGETIKAVAPDISDEEAVTIDADGMLILPGAIDVHTHMDLDVGFDRSCDTFYTGTIAAACGGTTTIVDHMAFGPKGALPWHQVEEYHRLADGEAVIDYSFHGVLQDKVDESVLTQMREIAEKEGITSFKLYLTYDSMLKDRDVCEVLAFAAENGILITVHCENDGIVNCLRDHYGAEGKLSASYHPKSRPAQAEAEAINRLLCMAECLDEAPVYIVHLSSKAGLEAVMRAKEKGRKHFGVETCPQYLLLDEALYDDPVEGLKAVMSPPLRTGADRDALWEALADDILDTVATDHCPFTFGKQKQRGRDDFRLCPNGAPGVEERLLLLYSEGCARGRLTLPQLVRYLCTNPARIFGLYPKKGILRPGSDADIVIFDPKAKGILTRKNLHGNADYTCYEGLETTGAVDTVIQRGQVIVKNNEFLGSRGDGKYLKRDISSLCR